MCRLPLSQELRVWTLKPGVEMRALMDARRVARRVMLACLAPCLPPAVPSLPAALPRPRAVLWPVTAQELSDQGEAGEDSSMPKMPANTSRDLGEREVSSAEHDSSKNRGGQGTRRRGSGKPSGDGRWRTEKGR